MPDSENNTPVTPPANTNGQSNGNVGQGESQVQMIIKWMLLGGIGMLVLISLRSLFSHGGLTNALTSCGIALLLGGACYGMGALVGFLFGIPRLLQSSASASDNAAMSKLVQNDNLVQISDWLTKIIVGVGLTQISSLFPTLLRMGKELAPSFGGESTTGANIAIGVILYFTITGFFSGYLWTRIHFYRLLAQTSIDVAELQDKVTQAEEQKAQAEEQKAIAEAEKAKAEQEKAKAEEEKKLMEEQKQAAELEKQETERLAEQKAKEVKKYFDDHIPTSEKQKTKSDTNFISDDGNEDPNAGQFGGQAEVNGRILEADVTGTSFHTEMYNVNMQVRSTDPSNELQGEVTFHLHPTFRNPVRSVPVVNGVAKLEIVAWGSFTVGVDCDGGTTKLELDLSKLEGVPEKFASR